MFSVNILQTHQSVQMERKAHHNEIRGLLSQTLPNPSASSLQVLFYGSQLLHFMIKLISPTFL